MTSDKPDKENPSNLELLGLSVSVMYESRIPKGQIFIQMNPNRGVTPLDLYNLLLQMASSYSFVQSRFGGQGPPSNVVDDLITPNLWESLP